MGFYLNKDNSQYLFNNLLIYLNDTKNMKLNTLIVLTTQCVLYVTGTQWDALDENESLLSKLLKAPHKRMSNKPGDTFYDDGYSEYMSSKKFSEPVMTKRVVDRSASNNNPKYQCADGSWFVFVDDEAACIDPLWDTGYNPKFCKKLRGGWTFCSCDGNTEPGLHMGVETCVVQTDTSGGRCQMVPCPDEYTCEDTVPGHRYDCLQGSYRVPNWYKSKN